MDQIQKPDVPALPFFESGNVYTGSICQSYRFRIAKEENGLTGSFWTQDVCYECAKDVQSEQFPLSEEGLKSCVDWIAAHQPL